MWRKISGCVLCSACFLSACDKSDNAVPPSAGGPVTAVAIPKEQPRPTTQQLNTRAELDLKFAPFTLMVPDGLWKVKTVDPGAGEPQQFLEGPTPSDPELMIHIPTLRSMTPDQEARLELHATEAMKQHGDLLGPAVIRSIPGAKVIEQISVSETMPAIDPTRPATPAATQPSKTVYWVFTVCVPAGKFFNAYDLSMGMTLKQFNADRGFVRSIMDTLKCTAPPAETPAK
jgi:hypothetical protein